MMSTSSILRENKGCAPRRMEASVAPMAKRKDDDTKGVIDPRVMEIIANITGMLERRGWNRADLARALGIDAPQVSNILNGKQGLSIPRMMDIYRALGAVMLVREGDPSAPVGIGTINAAGRLMTDAKVTAFPGYVLIGERSIGPYEPGTQVWLNAETEFVDGKWVLVERADGHELMKCEDREGQRYLISYSGDEVVFRPERHRILATSYGHFTPS